MDVDGGDDGRPRHPCRPVLEHLDDNWLPAQSDRLFAIFAVPGRRVYLTTTSPFICPAKAGRLRRTQGSKMSSPPPTPHGAPRVVICDYNSLLQSVTGLLRVSGYAVFQAYDGEAAEQLCNYIPDVDLLILNTEGTGMDTPELVRRARTTHPDLSVLHIGKNPIPGMPDDVLNLSDGFTIAQLVLAVDELLQARAT